MNERDRPHNVRQLEKEVYSCNECPADDMRLTGTLQALNDSLISTSQLRETVKKFCRARGITQDEYGSTLMFGRMNYDELVRLGRFLLRCNGCQAKHLNEG